MDNYEEMFAEAENWMLDVMQSDLGKKYTPLLNFMAGFGIMAAMQGGSWVSHGTVMFWLGYRRGQIDKENEQQRTTEFKTGEILS